MDGPTDGTNDLDSPPLAILAVLADAGFRVAVGRAARAFVVTATGQDGRGKTTADLFATPTVGRVQPPSGWTFEPCSTG